MWFGFKVITLVDSNQSNYFENAPICDKLKLKTRVATHLYGNIGCARVLVGVAVPQVGNEGIWDGGARYLHKLIEKQV